MTGAGTNPRRTRSSAPCCRCCTTTPRKSSASSSSSNSRVSTDAYDHRTGWHHLGRGQKGHQECPSERLSADGSGAHLCSPADESRHDPAVCDLQARLDQAAAEEAARAGAGNPARVSGPREPLRLGKTLPVEGG